MTYVNKGTSATVIWIIDGVRHDHVETFFMDDETRATKVRCHWDCMCKKKEGE